MEYIIDKEYEDVRLDRFLRKKYEDISLTEIFKGIRTGKVKVNGKKSKENYRLQLEDVVKVFFNGGETKEEKPVSIENKEIEKIKKSIVYEDERVLIFNKKNNMVMHKGSGYEYGISEMIKSYLKNENFNFVNRIDKATSGLIIGAKSLVVARELAEDIRNRDIEKKYYILVNGRIREKEFKIKSWLKKVEDKVIEVEEFQEGAKESTSSFKVVEYGKNCTLLEGTLGSGRTHQLRVQLANRGNYIIGDNKYGKGREKMMYLFSHYIKIERYNIEISLPIPKEFLEKLGNN
ncbi:MAG: RluA family pseudouridine synthase [Fusobacterium sp.]|uniref:RluA family pseudouridine synthase n=1 Tax=Fusobacterium sp. TaxID=68766 RepID=UPI0029436BAA|nr:RluA family pseudouridine synthase [Fusobacterium sp.]MDY3059059.1 RluA family pseudouridine synthase [Fusobacterium sp.]MEE1475172.1 RluA family pseudouridine synthase [Fusobacterium sp.]